MVKYGTTCGQAHKNCYLCASSYTDAIPRDLQAESRNYLIPADYHPSSAINARYAFCYQTEIINRLEAIKTRLNVVLVDACRSGDRLPKKEPAAGRRGLAPSPYMPDLRLPLGTVVGMACNTGMCALDGLGGSRNGLYTMALLKHIRSPEPIFKVLTMVNGEVQRLVAADPEEKNGTQICPVASSLVDPDATIV